ncbi:MAG TPA: efflux RND transporter periplasmic adaptor subunit [Mucilaginibacter sp.]|nr:efflux RND transporter periplasmic adaptor subunit [Mucilaginibacter sp.]
MKTIPLFIIIISLVACQQKQPAKTTTSHNQQDMPMDSDTIYSCSMHTQVIRHHPGKCPICGMTLIRVSTSKAVGPDEIQLTARQVQLGNITFDTIGHGLMRNSFTLTGTLGFDQSKITQISSRVMGRIDRLYFKTEGQYVRKGDKLYDLYSEDLNNAKSEYILAMEKKAALDNSLVDFDQVIQSAKNKLLLWGLTESQVRELATRHQVGLTTTFYSKADGYITTMNTKEGEYVMEGGPVMQLADLSTVWAEAQLYSSTYGAVNKNASADILVPELNQILTGKRLEFVNPELNPDSRILLLRTSIPNPGNKLKPGMAVYINIHNPGHSGLSLPIDAVLRDGNGASVWVALGKNMFKSVMVDVGAENGDNIEITSGLSEGDVVVRTGAYLLNSEYIFKKGANPMAGMKM